MIKETLRRLYRSGFINRRVILLLDVIIGVVAAFLADLLSRYILGSIQVLWYSTWLVCGLALLSTLLASILFKSYKQIFRYAAMGKSFKLLLMAAVNAILFAAFLALVAVLQGETFTTEVRGGLLLSILFLIFFFFIIGFFRWTMIKVAKWISSDMGDKPVVRKRILIYGVHHESAAVAELLMDSRRFEVVGFCARDKAEAKYQLKDKPIFHIGSPNSFIQLVRKYNIEGVVFPAKQDFLRERESFIAECAAIGLSTFLAPEIKESDPAGVVSESVREVKIEDLLMREVITHDKASVKAEYEGKCVLVTGAAGSIGSELVMQIAEYGVSKLVLMDNAESPLHNLRLKLAEKFPNLDFEPIIADVRSRDRVDNVFARFTPQIVLHAAAYKHVPLMEENPCESICVNVEGTKNVADACVRYNAEKMVMISTDKAVNPTNVMGACKRAAEMYVQSLGTAIKEGRMQGKTKFITTRFGNVLGSQGSVIHIFRDQIEKGGPVTITDPEIVRYFMSIPEACSLVLEASSLGTETQIFVFDMGDKHKIVDLARRMIKLAGLVPDRDIKIEFTGLRPGEKLYEEVLADDENTIKTDIPKVRIAVVRAVNYEEISPEYMELCMMARKNDPMEAVKRLKHLVPEYKSANSRFTLLDNPQQA